MALDDAQLQQGRSVYRALWNKETNPPRYANQGAGESEEGRKQTDIFFLRYHWGFCICPEQENNGAITGHAYRIEEVIGSLSLRVYPLDRVHNDTDRLLARILIAETGDKAGVEKIISDSNHIKAGTPQWNVHVWMDAIVQALKDDHEKHGSVWSMVGHGWPYMRAVARRYVRSEIAHGRYRWPFVVEEPASTFCLFENRVLTA